ncbi:fumarylacetoacetate hydrolase family protein [Paenisporosarcina indica]|uniref:fumarylacetoacetate hydrolase family protein n=1 Tax=Paenisporosarcina indica TaxID=650093 RepID=UPI00094F84AB|nr:fumarylacetoacetate hydrolase family protein [Paenisporosarcina indica]
MRIGRYEKNGEKFIGIETEESIINLKAYSNGEFNKNNSLKITDNMLDLIKNWSEFQPLVESVNSRDVSQEYVYKKDEVKTLAPIDNPGKVVCVGNNYMDHCIEQNVEPPKNPLIFSKWASCIVGPDEQVVLPQESSQVDYEAELVVVVGKSGKDIAESEAMEYVFGYTIMNDVSARDVQFADVQWVRGKSYDTFAPLGPVIVTADEIADPNKLDIKLQLNGEYLQDSNTKHLIFDIPYLISYLSKGFTFEPGDIIATGTPHGVGVFRKPPVFLGKGDVCKIEIEKIGVLENPIS